MYKEKLFQYKPIEELEYDLKYLSKIHTRHPRAFFADGDSIAIPTNHLVESISKTYKNLTNLKRLTAYASSISLNSKTIEELKEIRNAGLSTLYIGLESGNDQVLRMMNKGVNHKIQLEATLKAKEAGFKVSVMILNGLGGTELSHDHAIDSAHLVNEMQPHHLSLLSLYFPYGLKHFKDKLKEPFTPLNTKEHLEELLLFLTNCQLNNTVFRSDHASNHLVLKGALNRDKTKFIQQINYLLAAI